jgi:two-component system, NtrC family, response regulator
MVATPDAQEGSPTDQRPREFPTVSAGARLLVLSGADQGKQLRLEAGVYHVGRDESCQLVLRDGGVSRRHLELVVQPHGILVRDLDSRNGSFYEGARFSEVTVGPGALITVGDSVLKLLGTESSPHLLPSSRERFGALIGSSLAMREAFAQLERIAQSDAPVLIHGETGTGKELCAEAIHAEGARRDRPFIVCDLASMTRSLLESELFGHVRGAFTGAAKDRAGAFADADGGTIFIDEVGELEMELQPRLLRALERRQVKPVGGSIYREVDVRVIAATNRDLEREVKEGRFRQDLYHRLAVLGVRLPPLRERKDDIAPLARHLLSGREAQLSKSALRLLEEYDWPGNVRELRNILERGLSVMGADRELSASQLGLQSTEPPLADSHGLSDENFHDAKDRLIAGWERSYLSDLLRRAGGNISQAARTSGLGRPYLYKLMKRHGLGSYEEPT